MEEEILNYWPTVVFRTTVVSVEVNISIYCCSADIRIYLLLDYEIDRQIDVTAMQFLLIQNRQQTHDWTLIGSGFSHVFGLMDSANKNELAYDTLPGQPTCSIFPFLQVQESPLVCAPG